MSLPWPFLTLCVVPQIVLILISGRLLLRSLKMAKEFITINDHRPELFVMLRPTVPRYFFYYVVSQKWARRENWMRKSKRYPFNRSMLPNSFIWQCMHWDIDYYIWKFVSTKCFIPVIIRPWFSKQIQGQETLGH